MTQCPNCKHEFSGWDDVQEQIDRSAMNRYDWRRVFRGQTLTKKIAEQYAQGKTNEQAFKSLLDEVRTNGKATSENIRRLRIGVNARYGEIRSESRKISEVKGAIL